MSDITIRNAALADAPRILEIYAYYVEHTVITFEYDVPSLAEFEGRMRDIMQKYPYLVIERDGRIEGYAYAHAFVGRAAYDWAAELTIYLDHDARRGGLGRALYEALADRLKGMGILNLYARIGYTRRKRTNTSQKTVPSSTPILASPSRAPSTTAATNSAAGTIWSVWRRSSASTSPTSRMSCRIRIDPKPKSRCIQSGAPAFCVIRSPSAPYGIAAYTADNTGHGRREAVDGCPARVFCRETGR